ncbi:MAG: glycosyltransferase family 4 protein, partial [bacterium]
ERQSVERLLAPLLEAGRVDLVIAGRETFATHVPALACRFGVRNVVLAQGGTTWGLLSGAYPPELARALRDGLAGADCVIAVAHHLAERLRELGLQRIEVIPNAVDTHAFTPGPRDATLLRELDLPEASVIVAHVSNLKDIKRPLDLVHAAAAALPRDPRLWFVIVGDGPCRAQVEAECARAGVRDRFRFTEWVPRTSVPRYLRLADIVVMPSETEALALVYLETQACGRVLIASDIAAAREVVQHGVTGLLFAKGDCAALADSILRAAADPNLRTAIGTQARSFAERYTLEAALDAYERVFTVMPQP